ncbi:MAG: hypothetical protein ACRC46_03570 [Thermoguttaceae bacterium]
MIKCEFCEELEKAPYARFRKIYPNISNRIVDETENFVALPIIGQLFPNSLVALPRQHIETSAGFSPYLIQEFEFFINSLLVKLSKVGKPVFFEHGAVSCSGGGCGIYHAHVHIVPLPYSIEPKVFFPEFTAKARNISETLNELQGCDEYLLFGDMSEVLYASVKEMAQRPPSQFFRKRLVDRFSIHQSWDWRTYLHQEQSVLDTIQFFHSITN